MKRFLGGLIMVDALILAVGFVGGVVNDKLTAKEAMIGFLISIGIFIIAGKVGDIIE